MNILLSMMSTDISNNEHQKKAVRSVGFYRRDATIVTVLWKQLSEIIDMMIKESMKLEIKQANVITSQVEVNT
ncbi:hypothetical protein SAMN05428988_6556 [Chitinophaga sp. YR573]|uniref:hypothetical protein n=1 Tax=Chitinophaga sp. YR573 TaxID=1881040 RepID=UPI0008D4A6D9|nr:hypothetical protein [Chitinophaga sp. YR573]SEW46846.1 hypothetical protein SAMN05428988_6556 [Chitinophaga sp. YR573]